jgi:hypothetical protein
MKIQTLVTLDVVTTINVVALIWNIEMLMPCTTPLVSISFNVYMLQWPKLKCHFIVSSWDILSTCPTFNLSFEFWIDFPIGHKEPSLIHSNFMLWLGFES